MLISDNDGDDDY